MRAWAMLLLVGCGDNLTDPLAACRLQQAATVQDRRAIGMAAPYAADLSLAARDEQLAESIAARRAVAWQVVSRVVQPVPMGDLPGYSVPAWATWYARDDFERTFEHLFRALTPDQRKSRAPLDPVAGLQWNATALDGLSDWPEQRYQDYLAAVQTQSEAQGLGGVYRVGYSDGATKHLIESYARQFACRVGSDPPAYAADATKVGAPIVQREHVAVDACEMHVLGPYMAGAAKVHVTASDEVLVARGESPSLDVYDCRGKDCTVDGGEPVYVGVISPDAGAIDVSVAYTPQDVADPTCLDGAMPRDAVVVKADWQRVLGDPLDTFDTSAARMRTRLAGSAVWDPDGTADPNENAIYTMQLPSGAVFRLPALHIMSKELDHWIWITLWWSPHPEQDFGADRPALPGVWRNYKMCVSTAYVEGDGDRRGGYTGTLGDALAAVSTGQGGPTWCSNPYLELAGGNAGTNCIGCHQHGGTARLPEEILADPHHGTQRVRNNFFTDYLWAIKGGRGEEFSAIVQAELDYWDANDPP